MHLKFPNKIFKKEKNKVLMIDSLTPFSLTAADYPVLLSTLLTEGSLLDVRVSHILSSRRLGIC